jgi:SAM-dependent methyltransferase
MGVIGGELGIRILTWLSPSGENRNLDGSAYRDRSKLEVLFGADFFDVIRGKTVIDFGCGVGDEAIEMLHRGAARVIAIDVRQKFLDEGRARAAAAGLSDRIVFTTAADELADVVVSLDGFEHYDDPAAVLNFMTRCLKPCGQVIISFGTTWFHPFGGHIFSPIPWAHLLFTDRAMVAWRKRSHPEQTARTIEECGLNKMTIGRFERYVEASPLRFARYEILPIRRARKLWTPLTREFFTSVVQATLVPRTAHQGAVG